MSPGGALDGASLEVARRAAEHADEVDRDSCLPEAAIAALRQERLLSLLIEPGLGGQGRSLADVATICQTLARSCGSSAMIYAMHQIQVACIVAHGRHSNWHLTLLQKIAAEQLLLGSVTSEAGTGGNIHTSICAIDESDGQVRLEKDASTVSYGAAADALLITARRSRDAIPADQVMLVALRDNYTLERTDIWDAMGMRGTCSEAFHVRLAAAAEQMLPVPFADIANQTMLPVSHLLWSSVWLGIAADAVARARSYLRLQVRNPRAALSPGVSRLAKGVSLLQLMQSRLSAAITDYEAGFGTELDKLPLSFTADMNNLKTSVAELCLEVVQHAFMICGINAYKNGTGYSLGRHIRDLLSAPIMISNDRMLESTGNLLLTQRSVPGVLQAWI